MFFHTFAHTSIPPKTFFQKRYFLLSGVVKYVFYAFSQTFIPPETFFAEKILFTVWSG
jgi:hypothetical protein